MAFANAEIKQALSTTPRRRLVSQRGNYLDSHCFSKSVFDSTYSVKEEARLFRIDHKFYFTFMSSLLFFH